MKSLKALAEKVLERNAAWNDKRNAACDIVSGPSQRRDRRETLECDNRVIEATFTSAPALSPDEAIAPEFPPCPICGQVRYWLASGGRVLCGSRQCASAQRWHLIALTFHAIS